MAFTSLLGELYVLTQINPEWNFHLHDYFFTIHIQYGHHCQSVYAQIKLPFICVPFQIPIKANHIAFGLESDVPERV